MATPKGYSTAFQWQDLKRGITTSKSSPETTTGGLQGVPFWYSLLTDETQRTPENMTLIDPSAAEVQKSIQQ